MVTKFKTTVKLFLLLLLAMSSSLSFAIEKDETDKIFAAAPGKSTAEVQTPRKLLVFNLCLGYKHASIPYCSETIRILGEKTGAYTAVQSSDMSVFSKEGLKDFDAVCFNNTTQLEFNADQQKALMEFVKGGKGIVGIHAATDNFYNWPEAAEMMGGQFISHPWRAKGTWAIKIDEPKHPLNASFKEAGFKISDEIYLTRPPIYSRASQRVLMSLDVSDELTANAKDRENRDKDVGISWVKRYGQGRLFYCSLGHNKEVYWTPAVLSHYLAGIQYAMGDLKVDDRTSLEVVLDKISRYDYGKDRIGPVTLDRYLRDISGFPEQQKVYEKSFIQFLMSDSTLAGKQYICEKLSVIGSELSVPVLSGMLLSEETSEMSRFAIERISGSKADTALIYALGRTSGDTQIGIINSLGVRGCANATEVLGKFASSNGQDTAIAAISALSQIETDGAASIIMNVMGKASGKVKFAASDAALNLADSLISKGKTSEGVEIYKQLYENSEFPSISRAALKGMSVSMTTNELAEIFKTERGDLINIILMEISKLDGKAKTEKIKALSKQLSQFSSIGQIKIIEQLSEMGEYKFAVLSAVESLRSSNADVRLSALKTLGEIGDFSTVMVLAEKAASSKGRERSAARASLLKIQGKGVEKVIVDNIPKSPANMKIELIRVAGLRKIQKATGILLNSVKDNDPKVQVASLRALANTAKASDLPNLLEILPLLESDQARREFEKTAADLAGMIPEEKMPSRAVVEMLGRTNENNVALQISLYRLLGRIGDESSLNVLYKGIQSRNENIGRDCIRTLAQWPNDKPADRLLYIAKNSRSDLTKILALRGYINLVEFNNSKKPEKAFKMYDMAMKLAIRNEEKQLALSGLSKIYTPQAMELAGKYILVPLLRKEAVVACKEIALKIWASYPEKVTMALDEIDVIEQRAKVVIGKSSSVEIPVEQGYLQSPMQMVTDEGLAYMVVPNGLGYAKMDPDRGGRAIFRFKTTESGTLSLQFNINCFDIDNDSWHIKLDGNDFVQWNNIVTVNWKWMEFPNKYELEKGDHFLIINQREDGSKMSKIKLTLN